MHQISSSLSLFWKIFLPIFTLVFLGLGMVIFWFGDVENNGPGQLLVNRIIFTGLFFILAFVFYRTLIQIKRIDMDDQFVYVSNYFKTAKYAFDQIESIEEKSFLHRKIVSFYLNGKGAFGRKILFVPDRVRYEHFFKQHEVLSNLYKTV